MEYSPEVKEMVCVKQGPNNGPSPIPEEGKWVQARAVEDLSGLEVSDADWLVRDAVPETLLGLLAEVGRVYAPFLLANAAAIERGNARVECEIDGREWVQKSFPYQAKCLRWLREARAALARVRAGLSRKD